MRVLIGVIGSSKAVEPAQVLAYALGREIIRAGYSLICGGLGGIMESVCRGAHDEAGSSSGRIIGLLPGTMKNEANPYVDIVITTGMGYARNMIIACSSDAVIAVSGESGTLSEIAMAWNYGKPIIVMEGLPGITAQLIGGSLDIQKGRKRIEGAKDAREAIALIKRLLAP
jgi:hypothetical protein